MIHAVSIDAIKARLVDRLDELVAYLFPNAVADGDEWRMGDIHGAPGRSLAIVRRGRKAGWWVDWAEPDSSKGDVLTLVAAGACHGDLGEAVHWAKRWTGLETMDPEERRRIERQAESQRAKSRQTQATEAEDKRRRAHGHYLAARPIAGSPGERYLAGRAIRLDALARPANALRFHPSLWNTEANARLPAMVAAVSGPGHHFLTIHRTWLAIEPGRVGKARLAKVKQVYGPSKGGYIPIQRGASGRPAKLMPAGEWIAVTEGIEDALSVALAMPELRVWAALDLDHVADLPVPDQAGGLFWHRHRDGAAASADADRVRAKLLARGIAVADVWAPDGAKDMNEWLMRQAGLGGATEAVA